MKPHMQEQRRNPEPDPVKAQKGVRPPPTPQQPSGTTSLTVTTLIADAKSYEIDWSTAKASEAKLKSDRKANPQDGLVEKSLKAAPAETKAAAKQFKLTASAALALATVAKEKNDDGSLPDAEADFNYEEARVLVERSNGNMQPSPLGGFGASTTPLGDATLITTLLAKVVAADTKYRDALAAIKAAAGNDVREAAAKVSRDVARSLAIAAEEAARVYAQVAKGTEVADKLYIEAKRLVANYNILSWYLTPARGLQRQ